MRTTLSRVSLVVAGVIAAYFTAAWRRRLVNSASPGEVADAVTLLNDGQIVERGMSEEPETQARGFLCFVR